MSSGVLGGGAGQEPGIEPGGRAAAGEVGEVRQGFQRQFGAAARLVPGHGNGLVQGRGNVGPGQERGHRPGEGRPAEEDHTLDRLCRIRPEMLKQEPVRTHGIRAEPCVGGRLGEQRQAVRAGEASATGPAPCPASTTVRRSGSVGGAAGKARASGPWPIR